MNLSSLLSNLNYGTILLLMLIESTVIPFPSEVVVAPAAYHAAAGYQNVFLVVIFATIGADLGAIINYAAAFGTIISESFSDRNQAPELPCRVADEVEVIENSADASRPQAHGRKPFSKTAPVTV